MKKFFRTALTSVAIALCLSASAESIFTCSEITGYKPRSCSLVNAKTSACNQGAEPFSVFIQKWNSDAEFRKARIAYSANTPDFLGDTEKECIDNMMNQLSFAESYVGGFPIKAAKKHRDRYGCSAYATYFAVTADTVGFRYEYMCEGEDGGGSAGILGFERINGKWQMTCLALAG